MSIKMHKSCRNYDASTKLLDDGEQRRVDTAERKLVKKQREEHCETRCCQDDEDTANSQPNVIVS